MPVALRVGSQLRGGSMKLTAANGFESPSEVASTDGCGESLASWAGRREGSPLKKCLVRRSVNDEFPTSRGICPEAHPKVTCRAAYLPYLQLGQAQNV